MLPTASLVALLTLTSQSTSLWDYPDLLGYRYRPQAQLDKPPTLFTDMGAWHGFTAPAGNEFVGFYGPAAIEPFHWIEYSQELYLEVNGRRVDLRNGVKEVHSFPGLLVIVYRLTGFTIEARLAFINERSSVIYAWIRNETPEKAIIQMYWMSRPWRQPRPFQEPYLETDFTYGDHNPGASADDRPTFVLDPEETFGVARLHVVDFNASRAQATEHGSLAQMLHWGESQEGFGERFTPVLRPLAKRLETPSRKVAVKALQTLFANWRMVLGRTKHNVVSDSTLDQRMSLAGSWATATALAPFNRDLTKGILRAVFHGQEASGMVGPSWTFEPVANQEHSIPPLVGWALLQTYRANDSAIAKELLPRIVRQHQWWYKNRDHDGNGLCEYGSADGTLESAMAESSLPHAPRFEGAKLLQNSKGAHSLDQESVDLNCYLYLDKMCIAALKEALGEKADDWRADAEELKKRIVERFLDEETGYFFDANLDGDLIKVVGPEGWAPLWTGVASQEQAEKVKERIMSSDHFFAELPLTSLDRSHESFSAENEYARGPVRPDLVYFAVRGLERYGFKKDADTIRTALLSKADGILSNKPIHQSYSPILKTGLYAKHDSRAAAAFLMLAMGL